MSKFVIEEIAEKKEIESIVKKTQLSRNLYPNKKVWEKLGFKFYNIKNDDVLYDTILPEGWSLLPSVYKTWIDILDEQYRVRGKMFYSDYSIRRAYMYLKPRYDICANFIENNRIEIYFGNEEEQLYIAGHVVKNGDPSWDHIQEEILREQAKSWAEQNYPNYQDVTAYWDIVTKKNFKTKSKHQ